MPLKTVDAAIPLHPVTTSKIQVSFLMLSILDEISADESFKYFFLFFQEKRHWHIMQIVYSFGYSLFNILEVIKILDPFLSYNVFDLITVLCSYFFIIIIFFFSK